MKILITGIAGFIGSKIAYQALQSNYEVVGIDDLSQGEVSNIPQNVMFIKGDLTKEEVIKVLPEDIEVIMHLAGQSSGEISFDNPINDLEKNVSSTLNLIKFGIKNKVKKIIYASSMSVYGAPANGVASENQPCVPLSCYGVGKLASEHYLRIYSSQLPFVIFRMFNVYGPGQNMKNMRQGLVSIYISQLLKNKHIEVKGSVERFRDFIYIDDVVDIWLEAIQNPSINNEIFNIGTGVKTSINELLILLNEVESTSKYSVIEGTPGDTYGVYADISKLHKYFSKESMVPLRKGILEFYSWARREETLKSLKEG